MALTCGFYNSVDGDRKYDATQFASLFDGVITDGVVAAVGDFFATTPGGGMTVDVGTGRAWFNRTWTYSDAKIPLTLDGSDLLYDRIDAVVLEIDTSVAVRDNSIKVIKGTPAQEPQKPALTNAGDIHQYALAYVRVKASSVEVGAGDITINVGQADCPFVTSIVDTPELEVLFAQWDAQFTEWFENVQSQLEGDIAANLQRQIDALKVSDDIKNLYDLNSVADVDPNDLYLDMFTRFMSNRSIEIFEQSTKWTPSDSVMFEEDAIVVCVGAGGGGGRAPQGAGGGAGGMVSIKKVRLVQGTEYNITIGAGGAGGSANSDGGNGGTTSFSSLVSANGGGGGRANGDGGVGSSGGGGGVGNTSSRQGHGGNGLLFGGGGGCGTASSGYGGGGHGGNGGPYGGGGGGGYSHVSAGNGGTGGTYGGNGGKANTTSNASPGTRFVGLINKLYPFVIVPKTASGGQNLNSYSGNYKGGAGGGGLGGNGGNTSSTGSSGGGGAGGGGFCSNGGNAYNIIPYNAAETSNIGGAGGGGFCGNGGLGGNSISMGSQHYSNYSGGGGGGFFSPGGSAAYQYSTGENVYTNLVTPSGYGGGGAGGSDHYSPGSGANGVCLVIFSLKKEEEYE